MDFWVSAGRDSAFKAAHVGFCCGNVLFAREQQRDIHGHAFKCRFFDCRDTFRHARDLDHHVRSLGLSMKLGSLFDRARRVIGE